LIVVVVISSAVGLIYISGVEIMDEEKELEFKSAGAIVKWDNETSLGIGSNLSNIYEFTIIGESNDLTWVVEMFQRNNPITNYTIINIEELLKNKMEINIEINNLSTGIKEKKIWLEGDY